MKKNSTLDWKNIPGKKTISIGFLGSEIFLQLNEFFEYHFARILVIIEPPSRYKYKEADIERKEPPTLGFCITPYNGFQLKRERVQFQREPYYLTMTHLTTIHRLRQFNTMYLLTSLYVTPKLPWWLREYLEWVKRNRNYSTTLWHLLFQTTSVFSRRWFHRQASSMIVGLGSTPSTVEHSFQTNFQHVN